MVTALKQQVYRKSIKKSETSKVGDPWKILIPIKSRVKLRILTQFDTSKLVSILSWSQEN